MKKVLFLLLVTGWVVVGALGADVQSAQAGEAPVVPLPSYLHPGDAGAE